MKHKIVLKHARVHLDIDENHGELFINDMPLGKLSTLGCVRLVQESNAPEMVVTDGQHRLRAAEQGLPPVADTPRRRKVRAEVAEEVPIEEPSAGAAHCRYCDNPPAPGFKLCEPCRQKKAKALRKARAAKTAKNG